MDRHPSWGPFAVLCLVLAGACDKVAEQEKKADRALESANKEASRKVAAVAGEAEQKLAAAKAEADQKLAAMTTQAQQELEAAKAGAGQKLAEAEAGFLRLREDYRRATTGELAELEKKISGLEVKLARSKKITDTRLRLKLNQLKASRDGFLEDYRSLERASAQTWDETRARLDQRWAELKALADSI